MVQVESGDVAGRVERLLGEHRDALRRYQTMPADELARLLAEIDASVVVRRRADGDVGPTPPLYFELERGATRGTFLSADDSEGWEVGLDAAGRVLREGPERVHVHAAGHVDTLQVRSDGTIGGVARMVLEGGRVVAWIRLAYGGGETTTTIYTWSEEHVLRADQVSSRFPVTHAYLVEHGRDGLVASIVLAPDHVVFRRSPRSARALLRAIEREVRPLVELAIDTTPTELRPVYAVIVTYDGSSGIGCFPPSIWIGGAPIAAEVASGRRPPEHMWNPLIDALPESPIAVRDAAKGLGAELDAAARDELVAAYPKWAKRWTKELRSRPGVDERFCVLAFDPEKEAVGDVLGRALTARDRSALLAAGWLVEGSR